MLLILGYIADINILQKKLRLLQEQKLKANQLLQDKNQAIQKSELELKNTQTLPAEVVAQLQRFAGNFSIIDILNSAEKAAANSQVELQLLELQNTEEDDLFIMYPLKLEIYGQYKKLLEFINNIFKQTYFAIFTELNLQKRATNNSLDELSMQVLLTVYKNKNPGVEKTTVESAPAKNLAISLPEHDLFTKNTGKTNVFLWSSEELSFLGVIKQNKKIHGFVSDPLGVIHRVTIGDKIGLKLNRIVAIDDNGITTDANNKS